MSDRDKHLRHFAFRLIVDAIAIWISFTSGEHTEIDMQIASVTTKGIATRSCRELRTECLSLQFRRAYLRPATKLI